MFDESEITKEIADLESQLGKLKPTALTAAKSRLDRDELMYRCGWAAGQAELKKATTQAAPGRKKSIWSGPAVSATLATLCAILAFMVFQKHNLIEAPSSNVGLNTEQVTPPAVGRSQAPLANDYLASTESFDETIREQMVNARSQIFPSILAEHQMKTFKHSSYSTESDFEPVRNPSTVGTLLNELIENDRAL